MEQKGRISVVVPIYNAERYLVECIEGVLSQSYTDFELILVNDGSADSSLDICRKYAAKDSRIVVMDKPNGGVSSARNAALDRAVGEWVIFSDADDYYMPTAFQALVDAAMSVPDADLVAASCIRLEDGRRFVQCRLGDAVFDRPVTHIVNYALWGQLFRKSIIDKYRMRFPVGISYSEDRLFLFEYALHSRRMVTLRQSVYVYRIIPTSACRTNNVVGMARQQFQAVRKIMELQKIAPDDECAARIEYECEFIIYFVMQRASLYRLDIKALSAVKRDLDTICPVKLKTRLPFPLFCLVSRIRGIRRKYFPKREKLETVGVNTLMSGRRNI